MEPFTEDDLFPIMDFPSSNIGSCKECGALVGGENMGTHAVWHNKVADL